MAGDEKRDISQLPPYYEATPTSAPSSQVASSSRSAHQDSIRYLYYQIFEDGMAGTARNSIPELNEPSIGRLRARDIAPPRTVGIIKRAIAKAEDIPLSRIADLFLLAGASGEAAGDSKRLDILDEGSRGPGGTHEVPIAIVLDKEEDIFGPAIMSHSEPGKVASDARPKGWKLAKTAERGSAYLCLAMKPRGGLRWLDGTIESGKDMFVDPSGLVAMSDWSGNYSMYPVIIVESRLYGFMPADAIDFVPEATSTVKGKLASFKFKTIFGASSS